MMVGEGNQANPMVHVPPWNVFDNPTAGMLFPTPVSGVNGGGDYSPYLDALAALHRYLPSNDDPDSAESDIPIDAFSCDEFRMYEFKVRRCGRGRSHDWTECPYAHPGEKARRRDPRKFHYSGTACPDFRKGTCKRGDTCEFAHGVFECWLHPGRYRTQPCKDGTNCRRRVCFFAHTPEQLRILSQSPRTPSVSGSESYDGSPFRQAIDAAYFSPPLSPPSDSPPMSPNSPSLRRNANSVNGVLVSLRKLQLSKAKSGPLTTWGFGSPVGVGSPACGFSSLPATPTNLGWIDGWEEPTERVESGRDLRAKIFEKLSKENSVENPVGNSMETAGPDVGWVSELVK